MEEWKFKGPFSARPIKTLLELKIDRFCGALRAKPEWRRKVEDAAITAKWKAEAAEQGVSADEFDFAMKMRHYATLGGGTSVALSPVLGVFQDDAILTPELTQQLLAAVRPLEDVPAERKDWHPGSNGQVLDLVHPSLYPLVFGVSRRVDPPMPPGVNAWREHVGAGTVVPEPTGPRRYERGWPEVSGFQWLPTDVAVDAAGAARFRSYINNLHPGRHGALYAQLEALLTASLPLVATTLTQALAPSKTFVKVDMYDLYGSDNDAPSDENDDDAYDAWWNNRQVKNWPTVPETFDPPRPTTSVTLEGRTLQVIVKVGSIELTPEKPQYAGGTWHVEGTAHERIVATVIAYLESDNITESRLSFRVPIDEDVPYEQSDDNGVRQVFGLSDGDAMNQSAGSLECAQGRVVCFPNTMQHRVQPFRLADASRPGRRKIAVFFIVDPTMRRPSTRDVPPQQRSWWYEETRLLTRLQQLSVPLEVRQQIDSHIAYPYSRAQAETYRADLMAERAKAKSADEDEDIYEMEFSLCEH